MYSAGTGCTTLYCGFLLALLILFSGAETRILWRGGRHRPRRGLSTSRHSDCGFRDRSSRRVHGSVRLELEQFQRRFRSRRFRRVGICNFYFHSFYCSSSFLDYLCLAFLPCNRTLDLENIRELGRRQVQGCYG